MKTPVNLLSDEPGLGQQSPPIFNLVYCSKACGGVDEEMVTNIIASSHRNNPRYGLTGILVFGSGIFFQWLEGPKANVLKLMDGLHKDSRHLDIVVLSQIEDTEERLFPDWAMELVDSEHIREVLSDALTDITDARNAQALQSMLDKVSAEAH